MKKISIDFDDTLDRFDVQEYVIELIKRGFDVWICTARLEPKLAPTLNWNDDLFSVAKNCGISREKIIFCNEELKSVCIKDHEFIFHLDDSKIELKSLSDNTNIKPVCIMNNKFWRFECENIISSLS